MPFSEADFNDFLELLRSRPDLLVTARETLLGPEWQGIPAAIGRLSGQGQEVLGRLDRLELQMGSVDSRLEGLESRMDGVESRLDRIAPQVDRMESQLNDHDGTLDRLIALASVQAQATERNTQLLQEVATRLIAAESRIEDVHGVTQEILRRLPPQSDNGA